MPPSKIFASQTEIGDRVEGFGTVVEVDGLTDKTVTVVYEPFPEYVAINGVRRRQVLHTRHAILHLRP
jgi:hypothetical protein